MKTKRLREISERAHYERRMWGDPRKLKRYERKMLGSNNSLYYAFNLGMSDGEWRRQRRNPYPAGKRHAEYERGFSLADPMGDHYGRNV